MAERIRLLHVDDQPDFLSVSAEYLERLDDNFVIETATSPAEGLELLSEKDIECVISDYEMPETDGIEFLQRVQQEYPGLPLILFTGKGSEEIASEAISAGVTDYLQKGNGTEQYELLANRITNAVMQYRAEQDLEQIRDFFTDAERLGNLGAWELDRDDQLVLTDGSRKIFELDDETEVSLSDALEHYPPEDRQRIERALDRAREHSESFDLEASLSTTDGEMRWVRVSGEPIDTPVSQPLVRGYLQDITEQKERERELEQINHRLRTIITNIPLVLFVLNADGTFTVSEGNGLEKLDVEPGEIVGDSIEEVYGWHDGIIHDYQRATDGETVQSVREIDGMFFETTYQPIEEDGEVTATIGVAIDVTERQEREQALTELHDATLSLVDAEDRHAIYQLLVETGERILGFDIVTIDAVAGDSLRQVASSFDPAEREHFETLSLDTDDTFATRAYNRQETIVSDDIRAHDEVEAAGSEYRSALTLPIGEHGVFQGGSTDVEAFDDTDRELAELLVEHARVRLARLEDEQRLHDRTTELERQNDRLEEVTSVLSHDLRNPLNVASLRLDQARQNSDSEHLDTIAQSHERMEALIEDVLLLARGDEMVNEREPVDLDSLVDECWQTVDTAEATLDAETGRVVEADRQRLRQLLENLARNAVKHGGQDVAVTVGQLDDGFYVADDGPGIPPHERETVFESGYSTESDGTGLGLAIVAQIARVHGWTVRITEAATGGARFEIRGVTTPTND